MQILKSNRGSISLLSLFIVFIAFISLTALLGLRIQWRVRVREQLRLDRCVEKKAILLSKIQNRIRESNFRMIAERAAALAAALPTGGASLKAVKPILEIERAWQEVQLLNWKIEQAKWITNRGCDRKSDLLFPLPHLKWERLPSDSLGPMHLRWSGPKNEPLKIKLWKHPNFSGAEVHEDQNEWKANWSTFFIGAL